MNINNYAILCLLLGTIPGLTLLAFGMFTKSGILSKKNADRLYSIIVYSLMIITGIVIFYFNNK